MKRIYFDHAAATPVDPRVLRAMEPFWAGDFANPGAIHKEGVAAKKAAEEARAKIATLLGIHVDEIVFTGSATESANLALFGAVESWRRSHPNETPHIIVSAIEHDAVLEPARKLEETGVLVTWLPVDVRGIVRLDVLKKSLTKNTVLVSVMYANNEIGTIQPIREIAKILRKWKKEVRGVTRDRKSEKEANFSEVAPLKAEERPQAANDARYPLFHTDSTQAANYCDMNIPRLGVDLLTMNAAKIYGPKGIGLLALLRNIPLKPQIVGGGHEGGRRAGTENVPGIVGFAEAFRVTQEMREKESERLILLRDHAVGELKKISETQDWRKNTRSGLEEVSPKARPCIFSQAPCPILIINGDEVLRLPNNINFSVPGVDHEFLALQLDAKGFAVATKSACNENDAETSHVLTALRKADGTTFPKSGIRLSFGRSTTKKEVGLFLAALRETQRKS
ncbi:MAG: cysteine desulfurase family protein [bacterium]|nr:cysteine desulfurase family protein [bacterium]